MHKILDVCNKEIPLDKIKTYMKAMNHLSFKN